MLAAMLLFWCVGLYKRLMRLRARALDALDTVDSGLQRYSSLLAAQFPDKVGAYIPMAWAELMARVQALDAQCSAVRAVPLSAPPLAALARSIDAIEQAWSRLRNEPADLAGPTMPEAMQQLWDEAIASVHTARGQFNQTIGRYNHALYQFPASTVVGLMGFREAGTL